MITDAEIDAGQKIAERYVGTDEARELAHAVLEDVEILRSARDVAADAQAVALRETQADSPVLLATVVILAQGNDWFEARLGDGSYLYAAPGLERFLAQLPERIAARVKG